MAERRRRVVAELGRPETPSETAARKAESSRVYRSSQTFRNLIAALLASVAVVLVIAFAVPRASFPDSTSIDVAANAAAASASQNRAVLVPSAPADWRVNSASVVTTDGAAPAWTIVYAPPGSGFLRVGEAFDETETWARTVLQGATPGGAIELDGITWSVYDITDRQGAGNVSYALGTQAGPDHVLLYGTLTPDQTQQIALSLADQVRALQTSGGTAP